jgi:penicillin-binding protein 2
MKKVKGRRDKRQKRAPSKKLRISVIYSIAVLSFTGLIFREAYIQVANGAMFRNSEVNTQFIHVPVTPQRGWIYDANGQVLASDRPIDSIVFNNLTIMSSAEYHQEANELAPVLNTTPNKMYTLISTDKRDLQIPLVKNASVSQIAFVAEHQQDLPNVQVNQTYQRQYPQGDLAGQVLGYVGSITAQNEKEYASKGYINSQQVGVSGLEYQYESLLQGKPGAEALTVNNSNNTVLDVGMIPSPTPGDNIQLTLDGHMQAQAQMIVQNLINSSTNKSVIKEASAVMLNVRNGGVISMVSYPYLNPNWYTDGKGINSTQANYLANSGAQENYVIQSRAYPGSTVKPANLITALDNGVLNPYTEIDDTGYMYIGGTRINEDMNMAFGWLNSTRAIAVSSDVFFYTVGLELGKWYGSTATSGGSYPSKDGSYQNYLNTDYAKGLNTVFQGEANFGLGPLTGIDLPGEIRGIYYNEDAPQGYAQVPYNLQQSESSIATTGQYVNHGTPAVLAESGIGQEQEYTTMQLGEYAMTLADNGEKLKPHLLSMASLVPTEMAT